MSYPKDELPAPAAALEDDRSFELARLWFAADAPRLVARAELWPDPAAWGFVLGEMARDLARLYVERGGEPAATAEPEMTAALERIRAAFDAELDGVASGDASGGASGDASGGASGDPGGGGAGMHAG